MRSTKRQLESISVYKNSLWMLVILVSAFTYIYWTLPPNITNQLGGYIQVVTLAIFTVTSMIGVSTYKNQVEDRARMLDLQYCNMSQGKVSDVDRLFLGNSTLDRLYYDIYRTDPKIRQIQAMRGRIKITPEILKSEHQASNMIIQKMADIFAMERFNQKYNKDQIEWINTFRGWMQSPILRSHWDFFRYECHPEFCQFVDEVLIKKNKLIQSLRPSKVTIRQKI